MPHTSRGRATTDATNIDTEATTEAANNMKQRYAALCGGQLPVASSIKLSSRRWRRPFHPTARTEIIPYPLSLSSCGGVPCLVSIFMLHRNGRICAQHPPTPNTAQHQLFRGWCAWHCQQSISNVYTLAVRSTPPNTG